MSCRHEWGGAVIKGPVNHLLIDQCEKCGWMRERSTGEPGAADDGKLTDRIISYMRDEGLPLLVARGLVLRKNVRGAPNVYWLNDTSDEVKS